MHTIKKIGYLALVLLSSTAFGKKDFILMTTLYNEENPQRVEEFITCIERNLQHPSIERIHVFYDSLKDKPNAKSKIFKYLASRDISVSFVKGRVSFDQFFKLANTAYKDRNIIITNADIYFNETLALLDRYSLSGKFLCLTRWDVTKQGKLVPFLESASQDTWIFKAPIAPFQHGEIKLGTWHSDSQISYQAHLAGLKVHNPSKDIQCCHLHLSEIRNYNKDYDRSLKLMRVERVTLPEESSWTAFTLAWPEKASALRPWDEY